MERYGKSIVIIGGVIILIGIIVWRWGNKLHFLGHLPGDIRIVKDNVRIYIPITTMILISVIISFILWVIQKIR